MSLGEPMALGRTAEIYAWHDRQILKLFYDWMPEEAVQHEARIARAIQASGLAAPRVGQIVEVDGRLGLEYERLEGMVMGEAMAARPWTIPRSAAQLAELHTGVHAASPIEWLPPQRRRLGDKIRQARGLGAGLRDAALRALDRMPDGNRVCHGDFHPWNLFLTGDGVKVLDWPDATSGNPLADVARTAIILESMRAMKEMVTWKEKLIAPWYSRLYQRRYFQLRPGGVQEFRAWRPIVAACRMSESVVGTEDWLRRRVKVGLRAEHPEI